MRVREIVITPTAISTSASRSSSARRSSQTLETTKQLLKGLGYSERETERTVRTFRAHDERRLAEDYKHYTDMEKMQAKARSDAATLENLFEEDAKETEAADAAAKAAAGERARAAE